MAFTTESSPPKAPVIPKVARLSGVAYSSNNRMDQYPAFFWDVSKGNPPADASFGRHILNKVEPSDGMTTLLLEALFEILHHQKLFSHNVHKQKLQGHDLL